MNIGRHWRKEEIMSIRTLIVDDDANWRFLYRLMAERDEEIEIIGEFESAEHALNEIPRLRPDVAIVDFSLPAMSGVQFAEKLKRYPDVKVIILTAYEIEYVKGFLTDNISVVNKENAEEVLDKIKSLCSARV
jgi:YesN/AraC family two-component response regulator